MAQRFIGLDSDSAKRLSAVVRGAERLGIHVPRPGRTDYRDDYPVPVHVGKAAATIAAGGSGDAVIWSSTFSSTAAETAIGSTETVHSWGNQTAESGDSIIIFRSFRNGRLYFVNTITVPVSSDISGYSTEYFFPIITQSSSGGMVWVDLNSSAVTGYSTAVVNQYLTRSSTGVFWTSPSTCA